MTYDNDFSGENGKLSALFSFSQQLHIFCDFSSHSPDKNISVLLLFWCLSSFLLIYCQWRKGLVFIFYFFISFFFPGQSSDLWWEIWEFYLNSWFGEEDQVRTMKFLLFFFFLCNRENFLAWDLGKDWRLGVKWGKQNDRHHVIYSSFKASLFLLLFVHLQLSW